MQRRVDMDRLQELVRLHRMGTGGREVARHLAMRGNEYILPIQVEPVEVPGLLPTIGYVPLRDRQIEEIAELLRRKLGLR